MLCGQDPEDRRGQNLCRARDYRLRHRWCSIGGKGRRLENEAIIHGGMDNLQSGRSRSTDRGIKEQASIDRHVVTPRMSAASILVTGYDKAAGSRLVNYLNSENFKANWVPDAKGLLRLIATARPDLVVLDPKRDRTDGLELLQEIYRHSTVPVIFVSVRDGDEVDPVTALELGADDYIRKPLSLPELKARIRAKLRRQVSHRENLVQGRRYFFEGWVLDKLRRQLLSPEGNNVPLTGRQFALLSAFVQAPGTILSRPQLLNAAGMSEDVVDRSVDQHVFRLRRKLRDNSYGPRLIRAERGAGYVFELEVRVF